MFDLVECTEEKCYNDGEESDDMLFENEQLNVSRIYNVIKYAPRDHRIFRFPGKLPTYELLYYDTGEAEVTFGGKVFHVSPRSVVFLPKGLENNEYTLSVRGDFSLYNIYFDTADELPAEPVHIVLKNDEMKNRYEKIFRTWVGKREGYYYRSMQLTYEIIEYLRRTQRRYASGVRAERFEAVEEYISRHYCDLNFDYGELCSLSGLSYSYFKKLFIGRYGCPPVKYITRLKVDRACELLRTKSFSVSEIAELCGFDNVYYFSNVFKKYTGVSPTGYGSL